MIAGALAGAELPLSRPEIARDWVYVDDVVDLYLEAAMRAAELGGSVFNAGSGVSTSIDKIVDAILKLTGSASVPRWGKFEAPEHDRYPWIADPALTFSRFAWRPRVSLADGLARTIAALREATP
jgi:nucleoside-diphosphate-sugar epimerase